MKVRAIMTAQPKCAPSDASVAEVARIMAHHEVGAVPILDASGGVIAIITDRDVCKGAAMLERPLSQVLAITLASRHVVTCGPDDEVAWALYIMENHRIRRLPVVEDSGRLAGILSMDDIVLCAGIPQIQPSDTVTSKDAVDALKAIYRKRRADRFLIAPQ